MNRLLTLALLAALAVGCGSRGGNADGLPVIDIVGNLGTYRQIPMSELIEEVEYIPLETAPNFLVGRTDYVIVTDDRIFIEGISGTTSFCFAFTRQGEFISDIGRTGRGPGEWPYVSGMSVDQKNKIIYLDTLDKVFEYTWDGKFVRDLEKPNFEEGEVYQGRTSEVYFLKDNLFVGHLDNYSGKNPNNWIVFDDTGEIVKAFDNHIRIEKDEFGASYLRSTDPARVSNRMYVKEPINDTLYCLNERHELAPACVFDLGKYAFPLDVYLRWGDMTQIYSSSSIIIDSFVPTQNNIFFVTWLGNDMGIPTPPGISKTIVVFNQVAEGNDSGDVMGLYDIGSGKTELLDRDPVTRRLGLVNDLDGGLSFWPKYYNDSEKVLVDVWNAYEMKDLLTEEYFVAHPARDPAAHARLREMLKNLKETDNPVIVIAKLKD